MDKNAFCCGGGIIEEPLLTKKEQIRFKKKYGQCYDEKGYLLRNEKTKRCIFLTETGCKLSTKEKPYECLLYPIHTEKDEDSEIQYILETYCTHGDELIKELLKPKSKIKFKKYCKKCSWQCCTHLEEEGAKLSKAEQKLFKKKYGDCVNKDGYIKTINSNIESPCLFFDTTNSKCILKRKDRPKECLLYPFNYIYTPKGNPRQKIFELDMECLVARKIVKELTNRKN